MPVTPTYPGVYVQEVPSGVRTIVGVGTSTALFIGRTKRGRLNKPKRCTTYTDFVKTFSDDTSQGDLPRQVRMFFLNGGTDCYVMRIAKGATAASVTLKAENQASVLILEAKDAGLMGESIRAAVTYNGLQPEATFNLELFRWETDSKGQTVKTDRELWSNLSMDPLSSRYAPTFICQNSELIDAKLPTPAPAAAASGYSQSGRPVAYNSGGAPSFDTVWAGLFGSTATANRFQISVDGEPYVEVNLKGIVVAGQTQASLKTAVQTAIQTALQPGKTVAVDLAPGPTPPPVSNMTRMLKISSTTGDVFILPATESKEDLAGPLMLGTGQGGLEVSKYANLRPAPTGITFKTPADLVSFADRVQTDFDTITIGGTPILLGTSLVTVATAGSKMYQDGYSTGVTDHSDGVREKWAAIAAAVNNYRSNHSDFKWSAEVWGSRLALIPGDGGDNSVGSISTSGGGGVNINTNFHTNVRYYKVGANGAGSYQINPAGPASDGSAPDLGSYDNAYKVIDKEVDLFNLLILPKDEKHDADTIKNLWGPASVRCQERRAFLLIDPPAWKDTDAATHSQTGVAGLRLGLVKDYSAIFYPNVTITENGLKLNIGPSGTIAGLMARIDGTRGVWKAPAGIEADLRGVTGLEYQFSDRENGILNKRAVNVLRVFPNGIVNWGARTMDGDDDFTSEYKYVPIRRLALYIEESLYRGLKWVVFEPNDEPLWAQIRLNVGAFMHDLFRKGAFQGQKPRDAYFVKCDAETTNQTDRNLGIVNIWVGFAPLKPAEFVILYIQQMAGQIQV